MADPDWERCLTPVLHKAIPLLTNLVGGLLLERLLAQGIIMQHHYDEILQLKTTAIKADVARQIFQILTRTAAPNFDRFCTILDEIDGGSDLHRLLKGRVSQPAKEQVIFIEIDESLKAAYESHEVAIKSAMLKYLTEVYPGKKIVFELIFPPLLVRRGQRKRTREQRDESNPFFGTRTQIRILFPNSDSDCFERNRGMITTYLCRLMDLTESDVEIDVTIGSITLVIHIPGRGLVNLLVNLELNCENLQFLLEVDKSAMISLGRFAYVSVSILIDARQKMVKVIRDLEEDTILKQSKTEVSEHVGILLVSTGNLQYRAFAGIPDRMPPSLTPVVVNTFFEHFCGQRGKEENAKIYIALGEQWADILNAMEKVELAIAWPHDFFERVRHDSQIIPPVDLKTMGQKLFEAATEKLRNVEDRRVFLVALWLCVPSVLSLIQADKEMISEMALYVTKNGLQAENLDLQNSLLNLKLGANMKEVTTSVNVLFVGRSEAAKSMLKTALFGSVQGTPTDNSYFTCFSEKFQDRKVDLYISDIPIYQAAGMRRQLGAEKLLKEVDEYAEEIDLLVFCLDSTISFSAIDEAILSALGNVFGEDVWRNCVVALVNADGDDQNMDSDDDCVRNIQMKFSDFLAHAASWISYVPAGNVVSGNHDWLTEFWLTAAEKATAKAANFLIAHNVRCGRLNGEGKHQDAIILQEKHYNRIQVIINRIVEVPKQAKLKPKKKLRKKKAVDTVASRLAEPRTLSFKRQTRIDSESLPELPASAYVTELSEL